MQRAVLELVEAIYEQDFLGCSYGFRPGRSAQEALDEIDRVICRRPIRVYEELLASHPLQRPYIAELTSSTRRTSYVRLIGRRRSPTVLGVDVSDVDERRLM